MDAIAGILDSQTTLIIGTEREKNIEHDVAITQSFQERSRSVIRICECELRRKNRHILDKKLAPIVD